MPTAARCGRRWKRQRRAADADIAYSDGGFGRLRRPRWFLNRPERKDAFFWGERIRLTALWNDGAAFSLPLKRKLVTALSILILPLVWVFRRRSPIGAGLALGGGLSNLWERLRRGAVYDYVQFPKLPKIGRYVWNLADLAILIGGLLLALLERKK